MRQRSERDLRRAHHGSALLLSTLEEDWIQEACLSHSLFEGT